MEANFQVGRDRVSGFPCIRSNDSELFISVFPVVKMQVESWIYSGKFTPEYPEFVDGLIQRMSLIKNNRQDILSQYPSSIGQLSRMTLSELDKEHINSVVATNLQVWNNDEELKDKDVTFPTKQSEWGQFLKWQGAEIPDLHDWTGYLNCYGNYNTKSILKKIMSFDIDWKNPVAHFMYKYLKFVPEDEKGLPFMNKGFFELVNNREVYEKLTEEGERLKWVPCAAGEGAEAVWPTLEPISKSIYRPVLVANVPAVSVRALFQENMVVDRISNNIKRSFQLRYQPGAKRAQNHRSKQAPLSGKLVATAKSQVSMVNRCPICYTKTKPDFFANAGQHWCFKQLIERNGKRDTINVHTNSKPRKDKVLSDLISLNRSYLDIARSKVEDIQSVTASGVRRAGKSTWMISLMGMLQYPHNNPYFLEAFPESWGISRQIIDMRQYEGNELQQPIEEMWVDGVVPEPTKKMKAAMRSPILLTSNQANGFGRSVKKSRVLIINDIAGEIVTNPDELVDNEFFPHLNLSTDIIFIQPIQQWATAGNFLAKFADGLEANDFEGKRLDRKNINLIFCFSQIDWLRTQNDSRHQELLDIFIEAPYIFPRKRKEKDIKDYLSSMKQVHYRLNDLVYKNNSNLHQVAQGFGNGSVRYCGFSAFGFEPIMRVGEGKDKIGAKLPFPPHPVRVVDPLLWLMRGNGLLKF